MSENLFSNIHKEKLLTEIQQVVSSLDRTQSSLSTSISEIESKALTFSSIGQSEFDARLSRMKSNLHDYTPDFQDPGTITLFLKPFRDSKYYRNLYYWRVLGFISYAENNIDDWDTYYEKLENYDSKKVIPDYIWENVQLDFYEYIDSLEIIPSQLIYILESSIITGSLDDLQEFVYSSDGGSLLEITSFDEYYIAERISSIIFDMKNETKGCKNIERYIELKEILLDDFSVDVETENYFLQSYVDTTGTPVLTTVTIQEKFDSVIEDLYYDNNCNFLYSTILSGLTAQDIENIKDLRRVIDICTYQIYNQIKLFTRNKNVPLFLSFIPGGN